MHLEPGDTKSQAQGFLGSEEEPLERSGSCPPGLDQGPPPVPEKTREEAFSGSHFLVAKDGADVGVCGLCHPPCYLKVMSFCFLVCAASESTLQVPHKIQERVRSNKAREVLSLQVSAMIQMLHRPHPGRATSCHLSQTSVIFAHVSRALLTSPHS